jgi:dipeptidyl aminopeptidase/acylaminoacyl peptidase
MDSTRPLPVSAKLITLMLLALASANASSGQPQSQKRKPEQPTFWVVFDRVETPEYSFASFPYIDIYLMDQNGRHMRRLTSDHLSHSPSWSADGQQIAFLRNQRMPLDGKTFYPGYDAIMAYRDFFTISRDLFRMDADGKNASRVASLNPRAQDVTWFPDGEHFGVRIADRNAMLALVDSYGRFFPEDETQISFKDFLRSGQPADKNGSPWLYSNLLVWVPPVDNFSSTLVVSDGNQPALFHRFPKSLPAYADLHASLRVVSIDGATSEFPISAYDLSWSHDGKRFAYSSFSGDERSLLYASEVLDDHQETNRHTLTDQNLDAHGPAWSPDDSRIAFTALWKDSSQIYITTSDGSRLIQLSRNPKLSCFHVSWSPDGNWLVADCRENLTVMQPLTKEFGALSNIFLFDANEPGKKPKQLTTCKISGPLSSPNCGARNPSFAPAPPQLLAAKSNPAP